MENVLPPVSIYTTWDILYKLMKFHARRAEVRNLFIQSTKTMPMEYNGKVKGSALASFAISIVGLALAVTLLFILPEFIIDALNDTAVFDASDITDAQTKVDQVRNIGYVVIIISVVMLIAGVVQFRKSGGF